MARQLFPINVVAPGQRGLNLEESNSLLDAVWATVAENAVLDSNSRLAARDGYTDVTTTEISGTPDIKTLHEYVQDDATTEMIIAWDGGIGNDIDDPENNDISGAVSDADGTWWFQNFDDEVWGFQDGQKPIVYNGSGTFATVSESAGTAPTIADGVGLCAYGRVWGLDSDKQTIKFSVLLDGTDWNSTGSGSIDMRNIWTVGTDQVMAITAFNGFLIVFGRNHIVIWQDDTGSQLGFNPSNMVVTDVIEGTGCESQWTLQRLGEADLLFLSQHGLQSLSRVIVQKSNPVGTLSSKVRSELLSDLLNTSDITELRSTVYPEGGMYILSFPSRDRSWVFAYKRPYMDEQDRQQLYPVTTWDLVPTAWAYRKNTDLLLGVAGNIGQYGNVSTDAGSTYQLNYESGWLALGDQIDSVVKILKRFGGIIFTLTATTVTYKWDFDFKQQFTRKSVDFPAVGTAEWGEAEWSEGKWSGAISLRVKRFPADGSGQYIKIGLEVEVQSAFAIQQMDALSKLGRMS